jgi:Alr-MurF fusion protein
LLHFNIPIQELQPRFSALKPVSMRLSMKQAIHGSYLIDDSYNNDLSGLAIALEFLALQQYKGKRIVILSDILETHLRDEDLFAEIAEMLQMSDIDELVGIGEKFCQFQSKFSALKKCSFFEDTQGFLQSSVLSSLRQSLILVKGARRFAFEKIVQKLQQKTHGTTLEVNLDALSHNLNIYRGLLKPQVKLMVMVKAFAYGSGSTEVAHWLQFHRVDYLGVAYADEGVFLRNNGVKTPIMVMNPRLEAFEVMLEADLEPEIYSFSLLNDYLEFLKNYTPQVQNKIYTIHLKIDTGMRRLGFEPSDMPRLIEIFRHQVPDNVRVGSVFSHLAGADEARHNEFSKLQIQKFEQATRLLSDALKHSFLRHILNSPGIARFPQAQFEMVRLGIGLYGVEATEQFQNQLMNVGTLKTTISQIKSISKAETIGYGRRGVATEDGRIATIAIGYADGFSRKLGNGNYKVGVQGKLAPTIGSVCMDMTMIDITGIDAQEGDEVIIFGESPSIFDMAQSMGTIPYEVLTMVSERVKRIYFKE